MIAGCVATLLANSPARAQETGGPDDGNTTSVVDMLFQGSTFGLIIVAVILVLSVISTYFIIVHAVTITRRRLMPPRILDDLEQLLSDGDVNAAVVYCHEPRNWSMVTELVAAGLQRYQGSEFGLAEYRTAIEEAGEDQVGRLYRSTEVLNVIGAIAPMLGLTGTVVGMIEAFATIASREGMARPEELAGGIAQALVTTLLGLVVAIPTMVALCFFRTKIDSLVSEAGKRIERIMSPLGRRR
jgi:biopolymer transport protein ExbB